MRGWIISACILTAPACAHPSWNYDESSRIDEVMACEPWQPDAGVSQGIAVYSAPPLASPWKSGEGYQLERGSTRTRRATRASAQKPPRLKKRKSALPFDPATL